MTVGDVLSKINTIRTVKNILHDCIADPACTTVIASPKMASEIEFIDLIDILTQFESLLGMLPVKELK